MQYYYLNRIISTAVFILLILIGIYVCLGLFWYLSAYPVAARLGWLYLFRFLPQLNLNSVPGILSVCIPLLLFVVIARLSDMLFRRLRRDLYKKEVWAYQQKQQATYEANQRQKGG